MIPDSNSEQSPILFVSERPATIEEQEKHITEQLRMGLRIVETINAETKLRTGLVGWNSYHGLNVTIDTAKYDTPEP